MNKTIITLMLVISILLGGCVYNTPQIEMNKYSKDVANLDKLNDCTTMDSACDAWECLCDNMLSDNDYCQAYEDNCVKIHCIEKHNITGDLNPLEAQPIIHWMNDCNHTDNYAVITKASGCELKYEYTEPYTTRGFGIVIESNCYNRTIFIFDCRCK